MTLTIDIDIPDDLAERAAAAGLAPGDLSRELSQFAVATVALAAKNGTAGIPNKSAEADHNVPAPSLADDLAGLLAEAEALPAPSTPPASTASLSYGDAITEKYRRQGFNLP